MRNYYLTVIFLGILVISLVVTGFIVGGTPVSQKDIQLDKNRLTDFSEIMYKIENYYQINKSLPQSLSALPNSIPDRKDPETNTPYVYTAATDTSYKLCTTFSTDAKTTQQSSYTNSLEKTHKKGYDCISYTLPQYLIDNNHPAYTMPTTPQISETPITTGTSKNPSR